MGMLFVGIVVGVLHFASQSILAPLFHEIHIYFAAAHSKKLSAPFPGNLSLVSAIAACSKHYTRKYFLWWI